MSSTVSPAPRARRVGAVVLVLTLVTAATAVTLAVLNAPRSAATSELTATPPLLGADGDVPDGVTVFDDEYAAVARLDPELLAALRAAASDASADGITFTVNSGWRSPEYQNELLSEAVAEYGSEAEAARWVATADTSPHVQGDAVDIGGWDAAAWLSERGARYGLCQIYGNESWHFELRPAAVDSGCPEMYPDPTYDPRMRR
ncbi:M15 family metallopeptidase [Microbacterium terricola]|uniref:D-alanyl-D-alanine carboxypeptidase-like core domain-containing protein n=1 Tax=Microbacterium terricola TaxID=344163 RepID=A0ABM8DXV6_9MICO|nr:M15 family metallopeptidase [Microbacterium terricola]UYK38960.1 M15 family metallopeptidase [Microbacterium terricola]BDV30340.1 hypothetical protein Microterr_10000 [Microbacterium terricola]